MICPCICRILILTLAATALLGGCSLYSDPSINVTGIALTQRTDEAIALDVSLEMSNSNNVPLELLDFHYAFSVDGRRVFQGRRSAEATLGASGDHTVIIPVVVRYDQVDWQQFPPDQFDYSLSGHVQYITPGELAELLLDLGVRRPRAGFRNSGKVMLPNANAQPTPPASG